MADTDWLDAVRTVGFVYGIIALFGGIAVFVLSVRIPRNLLYQLPPVGRLVQNVAPWLMATSTNQGSSTGVLGPWLISLVFVSYGLWALGTALFGSTESR